MVATIKSGTEIEARVRLDVIRITFVGVGSGSTTRYSEIENPAKSLFLLAGARVLFAPVSGPAPCKQNLLQGFLPIAPDPLRSAAHQAVIAPMKTSKLPRLTNRTIKSRYRVSRKAIRDFLVAEFVPANHDIRQRAAALRHELSFQNDIHAKPIADREV